MDQYEETRFIDNGSDSLVIWFGGINEPLFSNSFAMISGYDCLFLRDAKLTWYMRGISEDHSSYHNVLKLRDNLTVNRPYKRKVFCGQSSGGYAALLFAKLCNADLVIAFAPQTKNTYDGQCKKTPHNVDLINLDDLYGNNDGGLKIIVNLSRSESSHISAFFWNDWLHIDAFRSKKNVTVMIHPYDNHSVSVLLRQDGVLYKFVIGLIEAYLPLDTLPLPPPSDAPHSINTG